MKDMSLELRDYIIYSDIDEKIKQAIQKVLCTYGDMEGDSYYKQDLYAITDCIEELLGSNVANIINALNKDDILNIDIDERIVTLNIINAIYDRYYRPYEIEDDNLDFIIYEHKTSVCEQLKHHYKCLYDSSLKWDVSNNQYNITATAKDVKDIILQARDSGGEMDWFGYAHDGTTMNCVRDFIIKKLKLNHDCMYDFDDEELNNIAEEIYEIVTESASKYRVTIY